PGDTNGVSDVFVSQNGTITRVSLGPNLTQADGPSFSPAISPDGQFVAFVSAADNLVLGDTNGALDVFVYDRSASTATRVSVASDGTQADGDSRSPSISIGGTAVAFTSSADNLVSGDANGANDVFVRTLGQTPSTLLVSVATGGSTGNGASDAGGHTDVFWRDLSATPAATERVSVTSNTMSNEGNGDSFSPSVSSDGDQIAFASDATNLVDRNGRDTNGVTQIYLRDRSSKLVQVMSQSCGGQLGDGQSFAPRITSDTNPSTAGVAFATDATNLLQGCAGSPAPDNNKLTDVYFRASGGSPVVTERVSVDPNGAEFNRPSREAAVSRDGQTVAFSTGAPDKATGGPGPGAHVFVRHRATTPVSTASTALVSSPGCGPAVGPAVTELPAISADGSTVAYVSTASDLVTDDSNGVSDVFVYDRGARTTSRVSVGPGGAQANG